MTTTTEVPEPKFFNPWRISGWGSAGALLAVPALAGWPWTGSGFALAATMLAAIGVIVELGVRHARNITQKAAFAIAVVTWFILLWIGFIGSADDHDANLLYLVEIAIALAGATVAKFRADGMARALFVAAFFQLAVTVRGYAAEWEFSDARGPIAQFIFNGCLIIPWVLAGVLFRRSAIRE